MDLALEPTGQIISSQSPILVVQQDEFGGFRVKLFISWDECSIWVIN